VTVSNSPARYRKRMSLLDSARNTVVTPRGVLYDAAAGMDAKAIRRAAFTARAGRSASTL